MGETDHQMIGTRYKHQ